MSLLKIVISLTLVNYIGRNICTILKIVEKYFDKLFFSFTGRYILLKINAIQGYNCTPARSTEKQRAVI